MQHHHRYLQHAPSGRSHCVCCHEWIDKGHLRVGTSFVPRGRHDTERVFVTWVHARCFTETRAKNLMELARAQCVDLKHYLVVPPSVHAGGSGPDSGTVGTFARFVAAQAAGDETAARALRIQLDKAAHHYDADGSGAPVTGQEQHAAAAAYAAQVMDWSFLDRQLREDTTVLDHMCKGDLLAVCAHQEAEAEAATKAATSAASGDETVEQLKLRILTCVRACVRA
jgi:hypothetical protein